MQQFSRLVFRGYADIGRYAERVLRIVHPTLCSQTRSLVSLQPCSVSAALPFPGKLLVNIDFSNTNCALKG